MGMLLPSLIVVTGIAVGAGSGYYLRSPAINSDIAPDQDHAKVPSLENTLDNTPEIPNDELAFVKLNNQFIIPVVTAERVSALVVLSITIETDTNSTDLIYNIEPKIRDVALRVLFNHSYSGGFEGNFTSPLKLDALRKALLEAINPLTGGTVSNILITDIVRQDN